MPPINLSSVYSQNFDSLANSGSNTWTNDSTIPGWYSNRPTYTAATGSSNTGSLYSFGSTGSTERALGSVASGSTDTIYYGVRLLNNTSNTINALNINYTGEEWRNGGNTTPQKLDFQYQIGATNITSGNWSDLDALDFTSPIATSTAGALDGNAAADRTALSSTLSGLTLAPNQEIWLRWQDLNDAGNDHGLGIDDFSVSATNASSPPPSPPPTSSTRIHDIQGAAHISPLNGQTVSNVPGIVTTLRSNGFYYEDPNPDTNDATSEGIFVFTNSTPTVAVGNSVLVNGTVSEFRPGGSSGANNLTTTEITNPTITTVSTGNPLPAPIILGNGGRAIPNMVIANAPTGNVETSGTFNPAQDGIDFYESLEGMLVQINNPVAVSPTDSFNEIWVLADNGVNATGRTARGGSLISQNDFNPERIQIDGTLATLPTVNVGAQLSTVTGVVDYSFNNFEVLPTTAPTVISNNLTREVTNLTSTDPDKLTVATFNVENLDPGDGATKFNGLASAIVNNLKTPDIISVEEIQDNNGPTDNGVVDASTTYQTLINAIAAAGGPTYQYRQIDPVNDTNGGEPGGNIRVGFLFNPNRVSFIDRPGGTSTSSDTVSNINGVPVLSDSPGLIDPTNSAFNSSRKPLVGEFAFNGQSVYVVGNHFISKGGDQPLFGPNQPPTLSSETQRDQQATIVKNFVQNILGVDPNANVVVAGDLNDYQFSNPLNILKSAGLTDLVENLPENERYTYNFQGNAQVLDHVLASSNLNNNSEFDVVHINSEFADQVSDHDPSVARFNLSAIRDTSTTGRGTLTGGPGNDVLIGGPGADSLTGGAGNDRFVYTSIRDQGDTINDFEVGKDKIVLTQLLSSLIPGGYSGTDAIADKYVQVVQGSNSTNFNVQIDADGPTGGDIFRPFITVNLLGTGNLNNASNFVF